MFILTLPLILNTTLKSSIQSWFKRISFMPSFELVDLTTINNQALIEDGNGNIYASQQKCKKL